MTKTHPPTCGCTSVSLSPRGRAHVYELPRAQANTCTIPTRVEKRASICLPGVVVRVDVKDRVHTG